MTQTIDNGILQKKIVIAINKNGGYDIKSSTVQKYPIGHSFPVSGLKEILQEGIKCTFAGDMTSEAPDINILLG